MSEGRLRCLRICPYKWLDTLSNRGLARSSSLSCPKLKSDIQHRWPFFNSSTSSVQIIVMKPSTLIVALVPVALAAPVANPEANAVAEDKRDGYASYGTYTNPAPPSEGYGTYTNYPATYATYPPPAGGYSSYGSYKRTLGGLVKKIFG